MALSGGINQRQGAQMSDFQKLLSAAYSGQKSQLFRFKPASHSDSKKPLIPVLTLPVIPVQESHLATG